MKRKFFMDRYFQAMRYFIVFFFYTFQCLSQNLVPNPSFEDYNPCGDPNITCKTINSGGIICKSSCCAMALPQSIYTINGATYNWSAYSYIPPYYCNNCSFNQWKETHGSNKDHKWYNPRTGKAHIIINTFGYWISDTSDVRQYAQVKLTTPLQAGCIYNISSYALYLTNLDDIFTFLWGNWKPTPSDGLGIYLCKDSLFITDISQRFEALDSLTPQISNPDGHLLDDSLEYEKISGIYKAVGGEQWLIIGNFKNDAQTQVLGNRDINKSFYAIDDVSVEPWRPNLVNLIDTSICEDTPLLVKLPDGLTHIKWSTGDTTQQVSLLGAGTYTVEASNGCEILRDTFSIQRRLRYTNPFDIGKDTFLCKIPIAFPLYAPSGFNEYAWSNGATTSHTTINAAGLYKISVHYECGTLTDSILITEFIQPDTLILPHADSTLCSNQSITLKVKNDLNYTSFLWNNGSGMNQLLVTSPGLYALKATTAKSCEVRDSIRIHMIYPPSISDLPDTIACEGTSFTYKVNTLSGEQVTWYNGTTLLHHTFYSSGNYWVQLSNNCYTVSDTLHVNFIDCSLNIPNLVTNNGDGMNDEFIIQSNINRPIEITIYNAWGNEIYREEKYTGQWGKEANAGIYFYQINDRLLNKKYKGWIQVVE